MKLFIRWFTILLGIVGVARGADVNDPVVAKIVVKADGALFFDGRRVAVRELDALLTSLKEKKGIVWYYRANPQSEPHPVAMDALKAIVAKQLPIKLFSKEDFSEVVGPDGKPQKQKRANKAPEPTPGSVTPRATE